MTIRREGGQWYASLSSDEGSPRRLLHPISDRQVGIDLGLQTCATLSTGEAFENPRWDRAAESKLSQAQRSLSRKQRGSKDAFQAKGRLARIPSNIRSLRRDVQHKLTNRILSECGLIVVDDLAARPVAEKSASGLRKSIQDAAGDQFLTILSCKAEEAGRTVVRVPTGGTSATWSQCGRSAKKGLAVREHRCACGLTLDRDHPAALNVLRRGIRLQAGA